MDKHIICDCDEVTLQWAVPFDTWIREKGLPVKGNLIDCHDFEEWTDIPHDHMIVLMEDFSFNVINKTQQAVPSAVDVLPKLHNEGWKFTAISACGVDEDFRKDRLERLSDLFGFHFEDLHVVPLRHHKRDKLSLFSPSIWVEDNFNHAVDGFNLGHTPFLLNYVYNQSKNHPHITRVKDWYDIYEHLKRLS